ncbi:MAG TPA: hypothetical protein VNR64_14120 [Vicinamibacterales bacterium]|nr:hypothetical protein [Vicinamibacterales bacterium]
MSMITPAASLQTNGSARAIVFAWLVAGTLDVTTAVTYYPLTASVTAKQILQGIASGVLGARAFQGGAATAALGLALHFLIALIWTLVFYVAATRITALTRRPFIIGPLYGTFVWLVMNLVVLPSSRVAHRPLRLQPSIIGAVILMICIGLPIAAIVGRHLRRRRAQYGY